jgi:hypothetical protein
MKTIKSILFLLLLVVTQQLTAQNLQFKGQLSAWTNYNPANELDLWGGARYIPQFNFEYGTVAKGLFDIEASANINGTLGTLPFDTLYSHGKIKPYRLWARYSNQQLEIRAGLQKINFGSASMIRPLMWFDKIDPRDPLQLTDGVWGILGRYYFLNNANIWLWALYGNKEAKTWEIGNTSQQRPEFGGRVQLPVPKGEVAFSYHNREVDKSGMGEMPAIVEIVNENRFGLDGKWDLGVGLWFEAAWMQKSKNMGMFTNQVSACIGTDYTFGIGNGLNLISEQLLFAYDEKPFAMEQAFLFSTLSLSYPLGMNDQLSALFYYDWKNNEIYNLVTWNHQFRRFTFYAMGYSNPKNYNIPLAANDVNLFAGTGIQIMLVIYP